MSPNTLSRRGAFCVQLSALSRDADAPHWVPLMMIPGSPGALPCCCAPSLTLLFSMVNKAAWDCLTRSLLTHLPQYLASLTEPRPSLGLQTASWKSTSPLPTLQMFQDYFHHWFHRGLRGFDHNNHRLALKLACLVKFPFCILLFSATSTTNQPTLLTEHFLQIFWELK